MIYKIESRQNSKIKEVVKLFQISEKKRQNRFLIEGYHLLEMALNKGAVEAIFTLKEIKDIPDSIPQYIVNDIILEKISETKAPQGVVAIVKNSPSKPLSSDKVLYLDDVSDPGNLGTLLRTALAFRYNDVILSPNCCSYLNAKVIQASQGAIFELNIITKSLDEISNLKDYEILATEIKGSIKLEDVKSASKHVLVLGNESRGVSDKILKFADKRIRIDIINIESLNVGVAGGIVMHYLSSLK